jgi:GTP-binding protein
MVPPCGTLPARLPVQWRPSRSIPVATQSDRTTEKLTRLPVVAVVGRPNIGKSTLVNRIVRRRAAVVQELPGVTRDRREFEAEWNGRKFVVVDTGGWQVSEDDDLVVDIKMQAEAAIAAADLVIFVLDAQADVSPDDAAVAELLRSASDRVIVVANKVDNDAIAQDLGALWRLGLGEPHPVSAIHGIGVADVLDLVVARLPEVAQLVDADRPRTLAIIGRPNVGKSTLLNRLLGEQRVVVSPVGGTTRDPIDVPVEIDGITYTLIDTAGIRRAPKVGEDAEFYSILRAKEVLRDADVALLLIDALDGVTHQDQRIAEEAEESGAGLVVVLNKWDAIDQDERERTEDGVADRFGFVKWAPVLRISAKNGARLKRLGPTVERVLANRQVRIPTGELNRLITGWTQAHPAPVRKGRRPKVLYAVQAGTEPPTIILFVSGGEIGEDYLRYLENRLRDTFGFEGSPIRLVARRKKPRDKR